MILAQILSSLLYIFHLSLVASLNFSFQRLLVSLIPANLSGFISYPHNQLQNTTCAF